MKTGIAVLLSGLLFAGAAAPVLAASPFLGSRGEPHGTLILNVNQSAKQIWPAKIWAVNGKLTNRSNQGYLWIKPGQYTFQVKTGVVNMADVPGLQRATDYGQKVHELKLDVKAGTVYFIGAKFKSSGDWQPVVWKTESSKH